MRFTGKKDDSNKSNGASAASTKSPNSSAEASVPGVDASRNDALVLPSTSLASRLELNPEEVLKFIETQTQIEKQQNSYLCESYFRTLDSDVENYALILDTLIAGSDGFVNLKRQKWGERLNQVLEAIPKLFQAHRRAWDASLPAYWDKNHRVVNIKPSAIKTEWSTMNTILIRIIRLARIAINPEDSTFYTSSEDYFYDPEEVKKNGEESNGPRKIYSAEFDTHKFVKKGVTQHSKLGKHYRLIVMTIVNYAQQNFRGREVLHSPDFMFLKLVLDRLDITVANVESNVGRALLLEQLGQLMALVRLADRIDLFSTFSANMLGKDQPQSIAYNQDGNVIINGTITMDQVIHQLNISLNHIRYEVQAIIDERSIREYGARFLKQASELELLCEIMFQGLSQAGGSIMDSEFFRLSSRETQIRTANTLNGSHALALTETEIQRRIHAPSFLPLAVKAASAMQKVTNDNAVASLGGARAYSEVGKKLILDHNPAKFNQTSQYKSFADDIYRIFCGMFAPLQKVQNGPELLKNQARDFALTLTFCLKLRAQLQFNGELLRSLGDKSGEFELRLRFEKDMMDLCQGLTDMIEMAKANIQRMKDTKSKINKLKNGGVKGELNENGSYKTLFSGKGATLIADIENLLDQMSQELNAFMTSLKSFTKDKWAAEILKVMKDGHNLANSGYYLGRDLTLLSQISNEGVRLQFNFDRHQNKRPFRLEDDFNARNLELLMEVTGEEALPTLPATPSLLAIEPGAATVSPTTRTAAESRSAKIEDFVRAQDSAETLALKQELAELRKLVLDFHAPALDANTKSQAARVARQYGQNGLATALEQEANALNEVASLQAQVLLLKRGLTYAYELLDMAKKANYENPKEYIEKFHQKCVEIAKQGFLNRDIQALNKALQAEIEKNRQENEVATQAANASASYIENALAISQIENQLLRRGQFELANLIRGSLALDKTEIEELLAAEEAGSPVYTSPDSVNNSNFAPTLPEKRLPDTKMLQACQLLAESKATFENIVGHITASYLPLAAGMSTATIQQPRSGIFNGLKTSKSPSPQNMLDLYFGPNRRFHPDKLFEHFLKECLTRPLSLESACDSFRSTMRHIFSVFFNAYIDKPDVTCRCICAGFITEMRALIDSESGTNLGFCESEELRNYAAKDMKAIVAENRELLVSFLGEENVSKICPNPVGPQSSTSLGKFGHH